MLNFDLQSELESIPRLYRDIPDEMMQNRDDLVNLCRDTGIRTLPSVGNPVMGEIAKRFLEIVDVPGGGKRLTIFGKPMTMGFSESWLPCAWTVIRSSDFIRQVNEGANNIGETITSIVSRLNGIASGLLSRALTIDVRPDLAQKVQLRDVTFVQDSPKAISVIPEPRRLTVVQ